MNSKYIVTLILTIAMGLNISAYGGDLFEAENPAGSHGTKASSGGDTGNSRTSDYGDKNGNALTIGYSGWGYFTEYTLRLSNKTSLTADLSYNPKSYISYWGEGTSMGVNVSLDIYSKPMALSGFYFGPDIGLLFFSGSETYWTLNPPYNNYLNGYWDSWSYSTMFLCTGVKIGYRWIIGEGFVLNLSLLTVYKWTSSINADGFCGVGLAF